MRERAPSIVLTPSAYDPVARRLAAALLLRDDPIDRDEAERILGFLSFVAGYLRAMARFMAGPDEREPGTAQPEWAAEVLDTYERCLVAARETGAGFKISF